jgi:hypothetical protein
MWAELIVNDVKISENAIFGFVMRNGNVQKYIANKNGERDLCLWKNC